VLEAKKLRKRIEQLQHYRRIGIRTQVPKQDIIEKKLGLKFLSTKV
jgi:hypothetical protein